MAKHTVATSNLMFRDLLNHCRLCTLLSPIWLFKVLAVRKIELVNEFYWIKEGLKKCKVDESLNPFLKKTIYEKGLSLQYIYC